MQHNGYYDSISRLNQLLEFDHKEWNNLNDLKQRISVVLQIFVRIDGGLPAEQALARKFILNTLVPEALDWSRYDPEMPIKFFAICDDECTVYYNNNNNKKNNKEYDCEGKDKGKGKDKSECGGNSDSLGINSGSDMSGSDSGGEGNSDSLGIDGDSKFKGGDVICIKYKHVWTVLDMLNNLLAGEYVGRHALMKNVSAARVHFYLSTPVFVSGLEL